MENDSPPSPRVPVLQRLRKDSEFSDCVIIVGAEEFAVHSNILSCLAPFFNAAFGGDFKESSIVNGKKRMTIGDTTPQAMSVLLDYAYEVEYTDRIVSDIPLAVDVMELANRFQISYLFEQCENVVVTNLSCENAVQVLQKVNLFGCKREIVDKIMLFITHNFEDSLCNENVGHLSKDDLLHFLQSEESIVDEFTRFETILVWWSKGNAKPTPHVTELLEEIRFELMDTEQMEKIFDDHSRDLTSTILRKMVSVRSKSAVTIPEIPRFQQHGSERTQTPCINRTFSVPFNTKLCVEGRDEWRKNRMFFKLGHWVMSLQFDFNDEQQIRVRLKCERRHTRRNTGINNLVSSGELKDELRKYKLDIEFEIASNGKEFSNSTYIQNHLFEETISFTTCTMIDELLNAEESSKQAVFTLSVFKNNDEDQDLSDSDSIVVLSEHHSNFEMLGYI